jgi:ribonuclease HII
VRCAPPDGALDAELASQYGLVAGVDEVGRGALAGPVVAAAVILAGGAVPAGVDDSKRLSAAQRERLAPLIEASAAAWTLTERDSLEIDRVNILNATVAAMTEAVERLFPAPGCVVVDALRLRGIAAPVVAEPRADARYLCVAAASILAKVARDRMMTEFARRYPGYGWERNKGYGTPEHLDALRRLGPSPLHRSSFAPMRVLA